MKKILPISLILLSGLHFTFAQNIRLSGTVTDLNGVPLEGAIVSIDLLTIGATTDKDGSYTMEVPGDQSENTVSASYLGYLSSSKEVIFDQTDISIDFALKENIFSLNDIEVTALKTGPDLLLRAPASITPFTGKFLESTGAQAISDFIQNAPGVTVQTNDANYLSVQIRGVSSTLIGNAPFGYYLDDFPFAFVGTPQVPEINPFDLERVGSIARAPGNPLWCRLSIRSGSNLNK